MTDEALRATKTWVHQISAPPSEVFPLLCPTREYDWIEPWECDLIYSETGFAEAGGVFTTRRAGEPLSVWTVSRYEPDHAIEFVIVADGSHVQKLDIQVARTEDGGSTVTWTRTITSLTGPGSPHVGRLLGGEFDAMMDMLGRMLEHYCTTGEMLRVSAG